MQKAHFQINRRFIFFAITVANYILFETELLKSFFFCVSFPIIIEQHLNQNIELTKT